ncbi:MrcB family domain-containing protein [Streptomyces fumanus]|uniref:MrcB family domain-containing protein n=1 Tax=Streptomyces fumanus TaxID=67302 RepID=UPI00340164CE
MPGFYTTPKPSAGPRESCDHHGPDHDSKFPHWVQVRLAPLTARRPGPRPGLRSCLRPAPARPAPVPRARQSATGCQRRATSLNQGTTEWSGGEFKARKPADLRRHVDWARPHIDQLTGTRPDLLTSIHLSSGTKLGKGYEPSNVVAIEYQRDAIPSSDVLSEDLLFMARLLGCLYKAADATPYIPGDLPVEVREAMQSAATTANRRSARKGGRGSSSLPPSAVSSKSAVSCSPRSTSRPRGGP